MSHSEDFTHLVLTRFNTAVGFAPSAKGLDDVWLKERLQLFERYCLPSVVAQRGATFHWLVFCDAASPEWFKQKMSSYGALVSTLYIDGPATDEVIAKSVATTGLASRPYLITTRLDNDDALGVDHLRLVQLKFKQQEREFLIFPFGLQLYRGRLYNTYWRSNPFLSLTEKIRADGSFTTVMCVEHNRVREAGRVRTILSAPQWLQVIHGSNLLNTLRGWPRMTRLAPSAFGISLPKQGSDTLIAQLNYSATAFSARGRRLVEKVIKAIRPRPS